MTALSVFIKKIKKTFPESLRYNSDNLCSPIQIPFRYLLATTVKALKNQK